MAYKPKSETDRVIHRLKIARGHIDKVISMVNENEYCIDILHQINAIEKGLKQTENVILEHHLNTCVAEAIKQGRKDHVVREVMEVITKKHA